jgi:hypothetical protein
MITADSLTPHPDRDRALRYKSRGISAWIVQWVGPEIAEAPLALASPNSRENVVAILSPRMPHRDVLRVSLALYKAHCATPTGLLALYHMERRTELTPLAPVYAIVSMALTGRQLSGPWTERFRVGRAPCLYSRKVANLKEVPDNKLSWQEVPIPKGQRPA